jgi:hypothetical protein
MGTTLTGTTPQDTYDSLIKVTDNGPISGTLKALSDGLGNDSTLSLSTTAASIAGTLAVTGNATFDTNTLFVDAANNRVGIGTTSPDGNLHIASATDGGIRIQGGASGLSYIDLADTASGTPAGSIAYNHIANAITFATGGSNAERVRITSAGNVGIGTSTPNFILETAGTTGIGVLSAGVDGVYTDILSSIYSGNAAEQNAIQTSVSGVEADSGFRFQVSNGGGSSSQTLSYQLNKSRHIFYANGTERVRVTTDGLTFNGDTAAANALDDYEEGTWTPVIQGGTSGTATYTVREGYYTKIGRQVVIQFFLTFQKNTIVGNVALEGLPFNVGNLGNQFPQAAILIDDLATPYTNPVLQLNNGATSGFIIVNNGSIISHNAMQGTQLGAGSMSLRGTATYFV